MNTEEKRMFVTRMHKYIPKMIYTLLVLFGLFYFWRSSYVLFLCLGLGGCLFVLTIYGAVIERQLRKKDEYVEIKKP